MVARTKKGTIASVIFGVAIATALMPPLCTAGYGLAKGNFPYFFGAMYLFVINTIFIGLATFLVLKLLRFPMLKYANSAKRKRTAQLASLLAGLVMIPPIFTFINVFKENRINNQINSYIENEIKSNPSLQLMNYDPQISEKTLSLNFFNEINEATKNDLTNELTNNPLYPNLVDFKLLMVYFKSVKLAGIFLTVYLHICHMCVRRPFFAPVDHGVDPGFISFKNSFYSSIS